MGYRRRSRELAMQALFCIDMRQTDPRQMLELFCRNFTPPKKVLPFFIKLISGVLQEKDQIDGIIEQISSNWKVSRMACVDRNIIRIAVYELLCLTDVPAKVSINEAIDIGKKFGTEESGAFINGVLDSIRKMVDMGKIKMQMPEHIFWQPDIDKTVSELSNECK